MGGRVWPYLQPQSITPKQEEPRFNTPAMNARQWRRHSFRVLASTHIGQTTSFNIGLRDEGVPPQRGDTSEDPDTFIVYDTLLNSAFLTLSLCSLLFLAGPECNNTRRRRAVLGGATGPRGDPPGCPLLPDPSTYRCSFVAPDYCCLNIRRSDIIRLYPNDV